MGTSFSDVLSSSTNMPGTVKGSWVRSATSKKSVMASNDSRELPWNNKPSRGGGQGNNLDTGAHQMSFAEMSASARGEYSKRSGSSGMAGNRLSSRGSPQFRSSSPRLQNANASSPHSHKDKLTPGPGDYSNGTTKNGQLSSYDSGSSGRGAGKGKAPTSSFGSAPPRLAYHTSLERREKGMPSPGSYATGHTVA